MTKLLVAFLVLGACDATAPAPANSPASVRAALDDSDRTIAYSGYLDFDGQPVNAAAVRMNFALYPCADAASCQPLWVAKGTWSNGFPANQNLSLPVFGGRFALELGAVGQNALPQIVFENGFEVLYLAMQIEGKTLATLQRIAPASKAISATEADRFRVRSAVDFDSGATINGAPTFTGSPAVDGSLAVTGAIVADGGVTFADGITRTTGTLARAGVVKSDGGYATGTDFELLHITLDLSGLGGHWMHAYANTSIAENSNNSNTVWLRLRLTKDGEVPLIIAGQRQGVGMYGGDLRNQSNSISTQTYWQIPAAWAVPGVRLALVAGGDSPVGDFYWGQQGDYSYFDGQGAGGTLGYAIH